MDFIFEFFIGSGCSIGPFTAQFFLFLRSPASNVSALLIPRLRPRLLSLKSKKIWPIFYPKKSWTSSHSFLSSPSYWRQLSSFCCWIHYFCTKTAPAPKSCTAKGDQGAWYPAWRWVSWFSKYASKIRGRVLYCCERLQWCPECLRWSSSNRLRISRVRPTASAWWISSLLFWGGPWSWQPGMSTCRCWASLRGQCRLKFSVRSILFSTRLICLFSRVMSYAGVACCLFRLGRP